MEDNHNEKEKLVSKKSKSLYKNKHYMSLAAFETLENEITNQLEGTRIFRTASGHEQTPYRVLSTKLQRSASVDCMPRMHPNAEPGRRALYGTLPFVAQFGMQNTEHAIRDVLVGASLNKGDGGTSAEALALKSIDVDEIVVTIPLILASLVAIIAQFIVGFNISVMNASALVVFPGHSTTEWSIAVSAFAIGGPGGALLGGYLTNKFGRRGAMMMSIWIFLLGGVCMTAAPNTFWLIPARLIIGFASGIVSVVGPVYLGEIAPPTLRGTLGTCTQFAIVIGILVADLLAFSLATVDYWRYLFAVTPALCIFQLMISPFLLESPRWLLSKNDRSFYARIVIKKLRGFRSDEEVEREVDNFLYAAEKHKGKRESAHSSGAFLDLFRDENMHRLVVSCVVLQMGQQLCGINAVFYYSTAFFEGVIDDALQGTALVAFINVLATYLAMKLMDSTGRRTLILLSSGGMFFSAIFITISLLGICPKSAALLAVNSFVAFFEIGLGPIPWLIVAEMFDAKYVATAMSFSCVVNWGCNFLVGMCFPFMTLYLGPWVFIPFAIVLAFTFLFTLFYLPETQGRTVEEIQTLVNSMKGNGNDEENSSQVDTLTCSVMTESPP
eukprot:gene929-1803_t